jgi:hypothetical protein
LAQGRPRGKINLGTAELLLAWFLDLAADTDTHR